MEWELDKAYTPWYELYAQSRRGTYGASLFFQSLVRSRGVSYLNDLVMATNWTTTTDEERARLSSLPRVTDDFYVFAQKFTLPFPYSIKDTDGSPIPNLAVISPEPKELSASGITPSSLTVSLDVNPFTIGVFQVSLDPGQTVSMFASADFKQRVAYRQADEETWHDLPGLSTTGTNIALQCNDKGDTVTLIILLVSTANKDNDHVTILFEQESTDPTCQCKMPPGVRYRGLQGATCSSYPPPSNGTGSCTGSNIKMDPCLISHDWNLDLAQMKALMENQAAAKHETQVNSIELSDSGTLNIDANGATFTYNHLELDVDETVEGIELPTSTVINGHLNAKIFVTRGGNGSGDVCLVAYAGDGSVVETDPLTGGFRLDLGADGEFVNQNYDVKYTCIAERLTLERYNANGVSVWGPYVYTS